MKWSPTPILGRSADDDLPVAPAGAHPADLVLCVAAGFRIATAAAGRCRGGSGRRGARPGGDRLFASEISSRGAAADPLLTVGKGSIVGRSRRVDPHQAPGARPRP